MDLLGQGVVQSYLLGLAIAQLIASLDELTGWSRLKLVGSWPLVVQCTFIFIVHDLSRARSMRSGACSSTATSTRAWAR